MRELGEGCLPAISLNVRLSLVSSCAQESQFLKDQQFLVKAVKESQAIQSSPHPPSAFSSI